jgi:hypothetical protein
MAVFTEQKAGMDRWWSACSVMSCSGGLFSLLSEVLFSHPLAQAHRAVLGLSHISFSPGIFLFVGCVMAVLVRAYLHVDLEGIMGDHSYLCSKY